MLLCLRRLHVMYYHGAQYKALGLQYIPVYFQILRRVIQCLVQLPIAATDLHGQPQPRQRTARAFSNTSWRCWCVAKLPGVARTKHPRELPIAANKSGSAKTYAFLAATARTLTAQMRSRCGTESLTRPNSLGLRQRPSRLCASAPRAHQSIQIHLRCAVMSSANDRVIRRPFDGTKKPKTDSSIYRTHLSVVYYGYGLGFAARRGGRKIRGRKIRSLLFGSQRRFMYHTKYKSLRCKPIYIC